MKINLPLLPMTMAAAFAVTFALATPVLAGDDLDRAAAETKNTEAMMEDKKEEAGDKAKETDAEGMADKVKSDAMEKIKGLD